MQYGKRGSVWHLRLDQAIATFALPSRIIASGGSWWDDMGTLMHPVERPGGEELKAPSKSQHQLASHGVSHLESRSSFPRKLPDAYSSRWQLTSYKTQTQNHHGKLFLKTQPTETVKYRSKLLLLFSASKFWGISYTPLGNHYKLCDPGQCPHV